MYTREPSEVIQGRSLPVVSTKRLLQPLTLKLGEVTLGQITADTPIWARLKTGLKKNMSVLACSVSVEPMSKSASPLPNTNLNDTFCSCGSTEEVLNELD